jgi:hypothetical protein
MLQAFAPHRFPATDEAPLEPDGRVPYCPYERFHTGKQKLSLDLVGPDSTDTLYYPYLLRVHCTPPRLLSIVYFDCVLHLTGRILDDLRALLRDHMISEIRVFNARRHLPPPPDTPLIETLALEPRRSAPLSDTRH